MQKKEDQPKPEIEPGKTPAPPEVPAPPTEVPAPIKEPPRPIPADPKAETEGLNSVADDPAAR